MSEKHLLREVSLCITAGNFTDAIELTDKGIDKYPNEKKFIICKAIIMRRLGLKKQSVELINSILDNVGYRWLVYYNRGEFHMEDKEWEEAIDCFEKVILITQHYEHVFIRILDCHLELRDYKKAKNILSIYKKTFKGSIEPYEYSVKIEELNGTLITLYRAHCTLLKQTLKYESDL